MRYTELTKKYRFLMDLGDLNIMDRAEMVLLEAIEGLERIKKEVTRRQGPQFPGGKVARSWTAEQKLYAAVYHSDSPPILLDLWRVVATLTPRESLVIQLRFGRFGPPNSFMDVGRVLGLSRERIRQIEAKGLRRLRHPRCRKLIRMLYDEPREEKDVPHNSNPS